MFIRMHAVYSLYTTVWPRQGCTTQVFTKKYDPEH